MIKISLPAYQICEATSLYLHSNSVDMAVADIKVSPDCWDDWGW